MDQHQQDLFFASYLSNQRANQVSSQMALAMERASLVSGFMAQGHSPEKAEALADVYMQPKIQQSQEPNAFELLVGYVALAAGVLFAICFVIALFQD